MFAVWLCCCSQHALSLFKSGKYKEAELSFRQAIQLRQEEADWEDDGAAIIFNNLAATLEKLRAPREAEVHGIV